MLAFELQFGLQGEPMFHRRKVGKASSHLPLGSLATRPLPRWISTGAAAGQLDCSAFSRRNKLETTCRAPVTEGRTVPFPTRSQAT